MHLPAHVWHVHRLSHVAKHYTVVKQAISPPCSVCILPWESDGPNGRPSVGCSLAMSRWCQVMVREEFGGNHSAVVLCLCLFLWCNCLTLTADWSLWHNYDCGNVQPAVNNEKRERWFLEGENIEQIWLECSQGLILVQRTRVCVLCMCFPVKGALQRDSICWVWPASWLGVKSQAIGVGSWPHVHIEGRIRKGIVAGQ